MAVEGTSLDIIYCHILIYVTYYITTYWLCRHWPCIVGAVDCLPQAIASGGSLHCSREGAFPLKLSEASINSRLENALPVLVLGTQVGSSQTIADPAGCDPVHVLQFPCSALAVSYRIAPRVTDLAFSDQD